MADTPSFPNRNPLLSGLWGVFQSAAQGRVSTADVWNSLRSTTAQWYQQAQGLPPIASPDEAQALGTQLLRDQGVSIFNVNTYRGAAGAWRGAKESLHNLDPDDQLTARAIFQPPWATTTGAETPSRYRIRTEWQITSVAGETTTQWTTDELSAPLTSVKDALDQATLSMQQNQYIALLSAGAPPFISDYEIEQV